MQKCMEVLKNTFLCNGLTDEEFQYFVSNANIQRKVYQKNEFVFREKDKPAKLFLLIDGSISIYRDTLSGKMLPIADIVDSGDIFGEVYLYMQKPEYDWNAVAKCKSEVLAMESQIFKTNEEEVPVVYYKIIKNLLAMFAKKAYILNTKMQVLNSGSLRQRIVRYMMNCPEKDGVVNMMVTREELADFLNTARPSLSRELGKMQKDGLIAVNGKEAVLLDKEALEEFL